MTETSNNSTFIENILLNLETDHPEWAAVITVIMPYIPALKKMLREQVEIVFDDMLNNRWRRVNRATVDLMSFDQKMALKREKHKKALADSASFYKHKKELYQVAMGIALNLLVALL